MVVAAVIAYLLGCLDTGYYLVRYRTGQDVRDLGSGGTGAKNVGRVLGRTGFVVVFIADCLKGGAALWVASLLGAGQAGIAIATIAVVLGHIFPVQLQFRGGKGASTALGALLVLVPLVAVATLLSSLVLYLLSRKPAASGVAAFALMPVFTWAFDYSSLVFLTVIGVTALLLFTHRVHLPETAGMFRRPPQAIDRVAT